MTPRPRPTRLWRTPYGRILIVNPSGTHDLGTGTLAETIWHAINNDQNIVSKAEITLRRELRRLDAGNRHRLDMELPQVAAAN